MTAFGRMRSFANVNSMSKADSGSNGSRASARSPSEDGPREAPAQRACPRWSNTGAYGYIVFSCACRRVQKRNRTLFSY
jgi:hypothetical protein